MKNISWSQLNIILAIVIGTIFLLGILGGVIYQSPRERAAYADVADMNDAWIVETNQDYDWATDLPCNLETPKGTAVSISHFLPEDIGMDYGIAFRSVYNEVQVKAGDTILYQYGVNERRPFLSSPVPNWNFVPIDQQYAGQLITITQISDYGAYSGLFTKVEAGSRSALLHQQWKESGWNILLSVLLLLLSGGLVWIALGLQIQKKLDFQFRYYMLLACVIAIWSISGSPLISVFVKNGYLFWLLHILTRMAIPVVYLMFLRCFAQKPQLITAIDFGVIASAVLYVIVVILQLLGLLEFPVTYDILGILYSVGFLVCTTGLLVGWLRYGRKELRAIAISNTLLAVIGIVNVFIRPNPLYQLESTLWQIGVILYLFLLLAIVVQVVLKQMDQRVEHVEAEYQSQRSIAVTMMSPNFLFASLNSLLAMTKAGSRSSAKFVFAFSKYLRYNLDSVREERLIPFPEELEHIAAYLELQQMRIPNLTVVIEDKMHDFAVPARSIEAIVENAVKHGMEKQERSGQVTVRSYERRDSYAIQIVDEGMGFDTDLLYRKTTPTSMQVVRERLEYYLGASVEVNSRPYKGTIVTVKIPKNMAHREPAGSVTQKGFHS
ncbi:MAG: histidine kinase [Bacteroides sp.]|nr:histidine kinase [Bacteroides sp.]MCM1550206.1 histidine kinase [Clostridium sp.]